MDSSRGRPVRLVRLPNYIDTTDLLAKALREDVAVQELLEILDLPYTGPGVATCALCMDKVAAKDERRRSRRKACAANRL